MSQMTVDLWTAAAEMPDAPAWLQELRRSALAKLHDIGWPGKNDPRYQYADIKWLGAGAEIADGTSLDADQLKPFLSGHEETLMVFVDGRFAPELSQTPDVDGLTACRMADALDYPQARHHLEKLAASDDPVELLHAATWRDGAFVLAEGDVAGVVHVLNVNTAAGGARSLHHAFVADENASLRVIESHAHVADNEAQHLAFSVLVAGRNARIDHVKIQKEDRNARHVATQQNLVLRHGRIHTVLADIGATSARQATTASLMEAGAEVDMQGVFFGQRKQRTDVWTRIDHLVPHCRSNETFKGIMDDEARGAFTGLIVVHPGANGTHSEQESRNLLLSRSAHIDSTPQLEILNDDVSCSHGSTIGQLDDDQLFFLRSRGIGKDRARMILTRAFASDVIRSVDDVDTRKLLDRYLHLWFIKHQEHLA